MSFSLCLMPDLYFALYFVINVIQKNFEQPDYQTYVAPKNLLIKVAKYEELSKEHKLVSEFFNTDFEPEHLSFNYKFLQKTA